MQELFLICGNKEAPGSFLPSHALTSLALVTRSLLSAARSIQTPRPWLHPGFFTYSWPNMAASPKFQVIPHSISVQRRQTLASSATHGLALRFSASRCSQRGYVMENNQGYGHRLFITVCGRGEGWLSWLFSC